MDLLDTTTTNTREDLSRADVTAGGFILCVFALGGIIAEAGGDLPRGIVIATAFAAAPGAVTIGCALMVLWPRKMDEGDDPPVGSWPHASRQASPAILRIAYLVADHVKVKFQHLWTLAQIAAMKNRWVRRTTKVFAVTVGYLALVALAGASIALFNVVIALW